MLCTTRDMTERREAETRARILATMVETSTDFIGVAGLDGLPIYLNRGGQGLVGLEGDEAVNQTKVEGYVFPDDLALLRETVLPQILHDGCWGADLRFRHLVTGEPIQVHCDIVRIDDPETGEPLQLATVTRDIRKEKAPRRYGWKPAGASTSSSPSSGTSCATRWPPSAAPSISCA